MKSVRGKYDGEKVILEEEVPIKGEALVIVTFIDQEKPTTSRKCGKEFPHWEQSRKITDGFDGAVLDLLLEERRKKH